MVHGQLIAEGRVQKLTYRQLHRLEKIDAKKARDAKLLELAQEAIRAGGVALEGGFAGLGLAMQGYLSGDAIAFGLKSAAGLVFLSWLLNSYPNFARTTHLDTLHWLHTGDGGGTNDDSQKGPYQPGGIGGDPSKQSPTSTYCFRYSVFSHTGAVGVVSHCYDTAKARDEAYNRVTAAVKERYDYPNTPPHPCP